MAQTQPPVQSFGSFSTETWQQIIAFLGSLYSTFAAGVTTGTIAAGVLTGALNVYLNSAATTPGNQTTRTAAQLWADACAAAGVALTGQWLPNGLTYTLIITQTAAGTLTLVGGTGVTITGTATVAQNTTRTFVVNLTPTAATFTSVDVGSYS
jgi:hypothetical protein